VFFIFILFLEQETNSIPINEYEKIKKKNESTKNISEIKSEPENNRYESKKKFQRDLIFNLFRSY
jgi:hypothetical protein